MPPSGITRRLSASAPGIAAGTGQSIIVGEVKQRGYVSEVAIQPAAASAANAGNYRTFTLYNRGSDGAGTTVVATLDTSTTGLADNDERLMTLSGTQANLLVVANDILELVETITGTGVAHSGYKVEVAIAGETA